MTLNLEITYNERGQLKCPFLSTLYNVNQDVKKIGLTYILDTRYGNIRYTQRQKGIVGEHITTLASEKDINVLMDAFNGATLEINSVALYALFKDYKKNMDKLTLYNDTDKMIVTLDNGSAIQIGRYITSNHPEYNSMCDESNQRLDFHEPVIEHRNRFTELTDEQVERISESILKCMMSDIHIRITKQLVPGISNKYNLAIFLDIERIMVEGNAEICRLYISQERKMVNHFHVYQVLKY